MNCPSCHAESPDAAAFCGECSARLSATCPGCGATNLATKKFCHACGTRLNGAPVSLPAAPRVAPPAVSERFANPQTYTPKHLAEKILTSKGAVQGEHLHGRQQDGPPHAGVIHRTRRQSIVPAGTTHSQGWPVTRVIRSKSAS